MSSWEEKRFGLRSEPQSRYLSGEICLSGHPTTSGIEYSPELTAKFCATCGAETIRACPACNASIRVDYHVPDFISAGHEYTPPNHCHNSGAPPFPWKTAKVEARQRASLWAKGTVCGRCPTCLYKLDFPSKNYVYKPFRAFRDRQ